MGLIQKSEDLTVSVSLKAFDTNSNRTLEKLLSKRETEIEHSKSYCQKEKQIKLMTTVKFLSIMTS